MKGKTERILVVEVNWRDRANGPLGKWNLQAKKVQYSITTSYPKFCDVSGALYAVIAERSFSFDPSPDDTKYVVKDSGETLAKNTTWK